MKNKNTRNFLTWLILFIVVAAISNIVGGPDGLAGKKMIFSEFMKNVDAGEVMQVEVKGNDLIGKLKDGSQFYTFLPEYPNLVSKLEEKNIEINALPLVSKSERIIAGILGWLPFILMIALWIFFARGASGAGGRGGAFGFGRSRAKLLQENKNKVTFADVAGIDEAKQELTEIVDVLKDPRKYTEVGAKIPRGCLLIGSPGTGKTLLARAIAGEANVPFFSI